MSDLTKLRLIDCAEFIQSYIQEQNPAFKSEIKPDRYARFVTVQYDQKDSSENFLHSIDTVIEIVIAKAKFKYPEFDIYKGEYTLGNWMQDIPGIWIDI